MIAARPQRRGCIDPISAVVLVVEDEVLIRMSIADDLATAGHSVIEAATADEALTVLEAGLVVDVVFTDVRLPGTLDGLDLMEIVRHRFPGVSVIVTSGHEVLSPERLGDGFAFVPKPYAPENVLDLVARTGTRRRSEDDGRHGTIAQKVGPAD